jgi:D-alanyl-D-alanine dipeptidase
MCALTKNSHDPKAEVHCVKYEILRKVMKEAMMQHYSRLRAKSNNKIRTWNIYRNRQGKFFLWNRFPPYL